MMTAIPDPIKPDEIDYALQAWPHEAERDLDMLHLEFFAFLVLTGRLVGDTEPRPKEEQDMRMIEHLAGYFGAGPTHRDKPPAPGPGYSGGS